MNGRLKLVSYQGKTAKKQRFFPCEKDGLERAFSLVSKNRLKKLQNQTNPPFFDRFGPTFYSG